MALTISPAAISTGLSQVRATLDIATDRPGMSEITAAVARWLDDIGADDGLLTLFIRHTSASLTIQENADADVQRDLVDALTRLAPENAGYRHATEGPDDMPAHIKAMLTSVSLTLPVVHGRTVLGTWQGIYLIEHRARPHRRTIALQFVGNLMDAK